MIYDLIDVVWYALTDLFGGQTLYDILYWFIGDYCSGGTPYTADVIDFSCILILIISIVFLFVFTIKLFLFILGKVCDLFC